MKCIKFLKNIVKFGSDLLSFYVSYIGTYSPINGNAIRILELEEGVDKYDIYYKTMDFFILM